MKKWGKRLAWIASICAALFLAGYIALSIFLTPDIRRFDVSQACLRYCELVATDRISGRPYYSQGRCVGVELDVAAQVNEILSGVQNFRRIYHVGTKPGGWSRSMIQFIPWGTFFPSHLNYHGRIYTFDDYESIYEELETILGEYYERKTS